MLLRGSLHCKIIAREGRTNLAHYQNIFYSKIKTSMVVLTYIVLALNKRVLPQNMSASPNAAWS